MFRPLIAKPNPTRANIFIINKAPEAPLPSCSLLQCELSFKHLNALIIIILSTRATTDNNTVETLYNRFTFIDFSTSAL